MTIKKLLWIVCLLVFSLHADGADDIDTYDYDHDNSSSDLNHDGNINGSIGITNDDYRGARGIQYDLSNIPSLDIDLIKHERQLQEVSSLNNIKEVVAQALAEDQGTGKTGQMLANKQQIKKMMKKLAQDQKDLQKKRDKPSKHNPVSREVRRLLDQQYRDQALASKTLSLTLKHTDIKDVLSLIGNITDTHLIVDADVTGTIQNIDFKDVSLGAALYVLLTHNHPKLALIKDFGVLRVVRLPVAIDRLQDVAQDMTEQDYESSCRVLFHARWDEPFKKRAEKLWEGIVGTNEKNNVFIMFDDTSKKVFFRGRKRHIEAFEKCLQELDIKIPQVRIDARVVIASKDFDEALGFQWSGVYDQRASIKHFNFAGLGTFLATTPEDPHPIHDLLSWSLNLLPASVHHVPIKIPILFGGKDLNTKRLGLTLNAAENRREIKTILKPSLLVNNDETAEILVGEEMPQETRLDETIEGKLTNVTTVNYKDVGMKIRIKPVVAPDQQTVFLDIFVENSMVIPLRDARRIGGFNYTIETSRSKNRVLLKNGQTTMIGGLISNAQEHIKTGVPILEKIPGLGALFRGSKKALIDKQLLLFITPTLV